jgi:hypothetical protein
MSEVVAAPRTWVDDRREVEDYEAQAHAEPLDGTVTSVGALESARRAVDLSIIVLIGVCEIAWIAAIALAVTYFLG